MGNHEKTLGIPEGFRHPMGYIIIPIGVGFPPDTHHWCITEPHGSSTIIFIVTNEALYTLVATVFEFEHGTNSSTKYRGGFL